MPTNALSLLGSLAPIGAVVLAGLWLLTLYERLTSSDDPSVRKSTSSGIGSMSMLVSGAYVSVLYASGIAVLSWPLVARNRAVALLLAVGVAVHAYLEKREVEMS